MGVRPLSRVELMLWVRGVTLTGSSNMAVALKILVVRQSSYCMINPCSKKEFIYI